MKQFVMNVEPKLIKEVDKLVKESGFYSSRNEFVREAIRTKVREANFQDEIQIIRKKMQKYKPRLKDRGDLTQAEKDEIAKDIFKKYYR